MLQAFGLPRRTPLSATLGAMPHRDRYLFICTNRREEGNPKGSCAQKGSEALVKELKGELLRLHAAMSVRD